MEPADRAADGRLDRLTAAIALAVVLVIVVAGASMAMDSQRTTPAAPGRPVRPVRTTPGTAPGRRARDRGRRPAPEESPASPPPTVPEPESRGPELLRTGQAAEARVISVVDERTIGPVTRSRLALKVEPADGTPFEVTLRVAFPTPEARADVKVGGTVPVRYDRDDHTRVVVDIPQQ